MPRRRSCACGSQRHASAKRETPLQALKAASRSFCKTCDSALWAGVALCSILLTKHNTIPIDISIARRKMWPRGGNTSSGESGEEDCPLGLHAMQVASGARRYRGAAPTSGAATATTMRSAAQHSRAPAPREGHPPSRAVGSRPCLAAACPLLHPGAAAAGHRMQRLAALPHLVEMAANAEAEARSQGSRSLGKDTVQRRETGAPPRAVLAGRRVAAVMAVGPPGGPARTRSACASLPTCRRSAAAAPTRPHSSSCRCAVLCLKCGPAAAAGGLLPETGVHQFLLLQVDAVLVPTLRGR